MFIRRTTRQRRPGLLTTPARTSVVESGAVAVEPGRVTLRHARTRAGAMTGIPELFAPTPEQILDQLERLGMLREQGVLTEEEFANQKWKILGF